jgi:hypothetical protein
MLRYTYISRLVSGVGGNVNGFTLDLQPKAAAGETAIATACV